MRRARKVRTLRVDEAERHFKILNKCFAPWGDEEEWKRRYLRFPGFDVTRNVLIVEEEGEWAGGVTAWFRDAVLSNGRKIKSSLAGDAYVLDTFEGRGVYSTAMRAVNEMARREGAVLGFAFPAIYGLAATALPKYGYTDVFYPVTRILVLNHERFLDDFLSRMQGVVLPKRFDDLVVKLIVSIGKKGGNRVIRAFRIEKGNLKETEMDSESAKRTDLTIKSNMEVLIDIASLYFQRKRKFYLYVILALVRRRLGLRISRRFVRVFLGF